MSWWTADRIVKSDIAKQAIGGGLMIKEELTRVREGRKRLVPKERCIVCAAAGWRDCS